jgi:hypothetical protein
MLQESNGVVSQGAAYLAELDNVEPAFPALIFRHEGLGPSEPDGQLHLGEGYTLPRLNELFTKFGLFVDSHCD